MLKNTALIKPSEILIGEDQYPIKTDFATWIKFDAILRDENIKTDGYILFELIKRLVFVSDIPQEDIEIILKALFDFYNLNRTQKEFKGALAKEQIYDFREDWNYIFAAFMQQYSINLYDCESMHWFEFKALFDCLKGTTFNTVMDIRGMDLNDVSEDKRKELSYQKEYYSLGNKFKAKRKAKDIEKEIMKKLGGEAHV